MTILNIHKFYYN